MVNQGGKDSEQKLGPYHDLEQSESQQPVYDQSGNYIFLNQL